MSAFASSWLSVGAETLVTRLQQQQHDAFDCDVLVVGSGYGGAVAAARLAGCTVDDGNGGRRNARIWLVERGREYLRGMFATRFSELPGQVRFGMQDGLPPRGYAEALFDVRLGGDANVLLGNGLGGGSLINAGVMVRPLPAVWEAGWPDTLDAARVAAGCDDALAMLQPAVAPAKTAKFQVLERLAAGSGDAAQLCPVAVNFDAPRRSASGVLMQPCTLCGDCLTGCNQGAKGTLDTNYLAYAARRQVGMFCGVTVERLDAPVSPTSPWQVLWHYTEASIRPAGGVPFVIRARRVVLAAGSLGSTEILLRSRAAGLGCSPHLGKGFSTNGDMVAAVFRHGAEVNAAADQESDPGDPLARRVGPTITGLVRAVTDAHAMAVEEFAVPGALSRVFGEIVSTFGVFGRRDGDWEPGPGEEAFTAAGKSITHSGLYGFMGDDGAQGSITLAAAPSGAATAIDGAARIVWPGLADNPLFNAQIQWLTDACVPGEGRVGGTVVTNPLWQPFGQNPKELFPGRSNAGAGAPTTVHPLGGCAMASSVDDGVVDCAGRVFRADGRLHDGLAVLDGAIVPKALGINPALTIAALAEQALPQLRDAWGLQLPPADAPQDLPERPLWAGRRPAPSQPTAVRLRESMRGLLHLGSGYYWARLDVEFAEVANLAGLLSELHKTVAVHAARLTLHRAAAGDDEFSRRPDAKAVACAQLQGRVRLFVEGAIAVRELRYELEVSDIQTDPLGLLRRGLPVVGTKLVARGSGSPWRHLTELRIAFDTIPDAGTLCLDLDDLAQRREAVLSVTQQSSAPDALADLGALALFVARLYLWGQLGALVPHGDYAPQDIVAHLAQRLPGKLKGGQEPTVHRFGAHGARLSRYVPAAGASGRPVMLVHGFGAAGSTFAHPSIPTNLVDFLLERGRDTWVLDLRTSIGNEPDDPDQARAGPWTFDEVAQQDIPAALEMITALVRSPVDVVAHCIGAAMFCVAALDVPSVHRNVGAVMLSQVGPLLEMSPPNRLRGYLASYLEQFIGAEEFDTRAEYRRKRGPDGTVQWQLDEAAARSALLVDVLLTTLPYPEGETKLEEDLVKRIGVDFRRLRRRCDAIWGHLMEFGNVDEQTWKHLDAINGWVKVRSLAQTIHYARQGLLTDAAGRNRSLRQEMFEQRFNFPVLLFHGQRNRVFDWRGSLASFELLQGLRGLPAQAEPTQTATTLHWGGSGSVQLHVAKTYGHQDCIVGKTAAADVFTPMFDFLQAAASKQPSPVVDGALPIAFEPPWIGPVFGALRRSADAAVWTLRLLVHPTPRRARTIGIVLVPLDPHGAAQLELARGCVPQDPAPGSPGNEFGGPKNAGIDHTVALLDQAHRLTLSTAAVPALFHRFLVLTAHSDLHLEPDQVFKRVHTAMVLELDGAVAADDWLPGGLKLHDQALQALRKEAAQWPKQPQRLQHALLNLSAAVCAAADTTDAQPASAPAALRFALASCQYPPGLMDEPVAGAAYGRLAGDCLDSAPPQLLLAMGDQVYLDATAGVFDPGAAGVPGDTVRKAYELNWRLPTFREAAAGLPIYTMLDDHEVRDNWQPRPGTPLDAEARWALQGFAAFQGTLNPPPLVPGGRHYAFRPAGACVIVLDTRSQREPRRAGTAADGIDLMQARIVPDAALHAACERLRSAPAKAAKFIVSPSPLLPLERFADDRPQERLRSDSWSGWPRSLLDLLGFIERERIERVVLLSGDAHGSAVCKLRLDGGLAVFAVMSSGLYTPWPFANARAEEFVLDGPVQLSDGKRTLKGTMHTAAWTSAAGYALVSLRADADDAHALLGVSLRAADGMNIDHWHDLRSPDGAWTSGIP